MFRALRTLAMFSTVMAAIPAASPQTSIEVLVLKSRRAEDVVAALAPLAGPGEAVTAHEGRLIVRASPATMVRIKDTLRALDEPGRMVSVSVRQVGARAVPTWGASARLGSRPGSKGRPVSPRSASVEAAAAGPGAEAPVADRAAAEATGEQEAAETESGVTQVLHVMEGARAFIEVGAAAPRPVNAGPGSPSAYTDAVTGFYVVPRLREDGFALEISTRQEEVGDRGRVEGLRLSTTVTGALGRWIRVGSVLRTQSESAWGLWSASLREAIDQRSLELRVDVP